MNIPESPYQRLIDIIDVILVKNEVSQKDRISIHVADIPSLPLNALGANILNEFLISLSKRNLIDNLKVGSPCYVSKITKQGEEKLIIERKALFDKTKTGYPVDNKKIVLKGQKITFDDDEGAIIVGNRKCKLPSYKNGHYFCRAIFSYPVSEPVDWSIIYKDMTGTQEDIPDKKYYKTVQDTMYAVNDKIREVINTDDDLFSWENKTIKRNF